MSYLEVLPLKLSALTSIVPFETEHCKRRRKVICRIDVAGPHGLRKPEVNPVLI